MFEYAARVSFNTVQRQLLSVGQGAHNLRAYVKYLETRMCLYLGLPPFYKKKEKQRLSGNNIAKVGVLRVTSDILHIGYL